MKKILFFVLCVALSYVSFGSATTLGKWRWRNNDGNAANATYAAAENTPINLGTSGPIRLRCSLFSNNYDRSADSDEGVKLQYRTGLNGSWIDVDDNNGAWNPSASTFVNNKTADNVERLSDPSGSDYSSQTFRSGTILTTSTTATNMAIQDDSKYEIEFTITPGSGIATSTTYYFRMVGFSGSSDQEPGTQTNGYPSLTTATVLPVTLLGFDAVKSAGKVSLSWATASELNSASFVVERSSNASTFAPVATVAAVGTGANKYATVDASPLSGVSYYRLKSVDKDGTATYSAIVKVDVSLAGSVSVYPTLATSSVTVNVTDASLFGTRASLVDLGGRVLSQFNITGSLQKVDVSSFAAGLYFVRLQDGSSVKFAKQ